MFELAACLACIYAIYFYSRTTKEGYVNRNTTNPSQSVPYGLARGSGGMEQGCRQKYENVGEASPAVVQMVFMIHPGERRVLIRGYS